MIKVLFLLKPADKKPVLHGKKMKVQIILNLTIKARKNFERGRVSHAAISALYYGYTLLLSSITEPNYASQQFWLLILAFDLIFHINY